MPFKSREITANFRYVDVDNQGVFYTDVNAYKISKREVGKGLKSWENPGEPKSIASRFYPINSAIFLEDSKQKDFLAVLPTQTYAASAYSKGRIEILIIRQGNRGIDLIENLAEPITDWSED